MYDNPPISAWAYLWRCALYSIAGWIAFYVVFLVVGAALGATAAWAAGRAFPVGYRDEWYVRIELLLGTIAGSMALAIASARPALAQRRFLQRWHRVPKQLVAA